jgi:hypothetical protein
MDGKVGRKDRDSLRNWDIGQWSEWCGRDLTGGTPKPQFPKYYAKQRAQQSERISRTIVFFVNRTHGAVPSSLVQDPF